MKGQLYIDLSEAKLPDEWPKHWPLRIPVRRGQYQLDYDVVEEKMPGGWRAEANEYLDQRDNGQVFSHDLPLGFNASTLPPGAVIVAVEGD